MRLAKGAARALVAVVWVLVWHEVAQACIRRGFALAPVAMSGAGMPDSCQVTEGATSVKVKLVGAQDVAAQRSAVEALVKDYGDRLVVVDFTHPSAVNPNAELYCAAGAAFVMGTTGGDREQLLQAVDKSGVYAVIAPNMAKQIVALQATLERMARDFPGAFSGYQLDVVESHQKTKADTSGTAKSIVESFQKMGLSFNVDQIKKLRDEESQKDFGVPADHLNGHAFHTYTLTSDDGSAQFQFKHNVCGRLTYADGVADAVEFLAKRHAEKSAKKLFNMVDILEAGAMR